MKKNNIKKTPRIAKLILQRLKNYQKDYAITGDIEEFYYDRIKEKGDLKAKAWLWLQLVTAAPLYVKLTLYWRCVMLKNHLKITVRNLKRQRLYSLINITGLAFGLACSFVILMYLMYHLSFDRHLENRDNIYRLCTKDDKGGTLYASTPYKLAPLLKEEIPELSTICRMNRDAVLVKKGNDFIREPDFIFADPEVFGIFKFKFLKGTPKGALTGPYSIILTRNMAVKYFGDEDPVGKILTIRRRNFSQDGGDPLIHYDLKVTAVIENIPDNTHFSADFFVPISGKLWGYENINRKRVFPSFEAWSSFDFWTYVLLEDTDNIEDIKEKISAVLNNYKKNIIIFGNRKGEYEYSFNFQPLKKIHLYSAHLVKDINKQVDIRVVYVFAFISLMILLIALINYIILSTARSSDRAKEIGMRKVVGADRRNIVFQVMSESVFLAVFSMPIAILLIMLFLPQFNALFGTNLSLSYFSNLYCLSGFIGITIFSALISGSYISVYLSAFKPVDVLKNRLNIGSGKSFFRNILIVFQISIFVMLIVCSIVGYRQVKFLTNKFVLGFDKENVLSIHVSNSSFYSKYQSFKNEVKKHPDILGISSSFCNPPANYAEISFYLGRMIPRLGRMHYSSGSGFNSKEEIPIKDVTPDMDFDVYEKIEADYDLLQTLGAPLVKGQYFSENYQYSKNEIIVNETYVKDKRIDNPVGKTINIASQNKTIIGVVKDFHTRSLYKKIEPLIVKVFTKYIRQVVIRTRPGKLGETLGYLKEKWAEFNPYTPFEYTILDESISSNYKSEFQLGRIIGYFTFMAVFIACMGLFGLIMFSTQQRAKEIGIRKVFGASIFNVVNLILKQIIILIIIANIIAWPFAWYAVKKWLESFAYRVDVTIFFFILSAVLSLILALVTVGFQVFKAAAANPVNSLRSE